MATPAKGAAKEQDRSGEGDASQTAKDHVQSAGRGAAELPVADPANVSPSEPSPPGPSVASSTALPAEYGTKDDDLLAAAQVMAPSLTAEFCDRHGLTDDDLRDIANGLVPPPPTNGPIDNTDLHRTPGGWQVTPKGVPVEHVGRGAIAR